MNCEDVLVAAIQKDISNIFLRSLPPPDYASISRHFTRVTFPPRSDIIRDGDPIRFFDFPEHGILALGSPVSERIRCLTALIGREGFFGWPALLEGAQSHCHVGTGGERVTLLRIDVLHLRPLIDERTSLRNSIFRFVHAVMVQMSSTIVSSKTDPIERRLARMILMHHDRANGDNICITHQDMADMLMIRRASVTDALHVMEGNRLIVSTRNKIVMRDRPGMCQLAGKSYGAAEEHYSRCVAPLFPVR